MKTLEVLSEQITWQGETRIVKDEFGVNKYGEGLFVRRIDGTWGALMGTGQFNAKSPKEMMRKLRASWLNSYEQIRMVRGSARGWIDV